MIASALWALGVVLCVEGLVLALAPGRLEQVLDALRDMPQEARRMVGLLAVLAGAMVLTALRAAGL